MLFPLFFPISLKENQESQIKIQELQKILDGKKGSLRKTHKESDGGE